MKIDSLYCLVYRTGGTENFKWNRSLAMTWTQAIVRKNEMIRAGYKTMVENYEKSLAIGLPETFEP